MPAARAAVFDSNILIDFANRRSGAAATLKAYDTRYISTITYIEFMVGVSIGHEKMAEDFIGDLFKVIPPDDHITNLTISLRRIARLKLPDAMIYATAKSLAVPLLTRNSRDFDPRQPDILIPYE